MVVDGRIPHLSRLVLYTPLPTAEPPANMMSPDKQRVAAAAVNAPATPTQS
jgi:hypothetical protein